MQNLPVQVKGVFSLCGSTGKNSFQISEQNRALACGSVLKLPRQRKLGALCAASSKATSDGSVEDDCDSWFRSWHTRSTNAWMDARLGEATGFLLWRRAKERALQLEEAAGSAEASAREAAEGTNWKARLVAGKESSASRKVADAARAELEAAEAELEELKRKLRGAERTRQAAAEMALMQVESLWDPRRAAADARLGSWRSLVSAKAPQGRPMRRRGRLRFNPRRAAAGRPQRNLQPAQREPQSGKGNGQGPPLTPQLMESYDLLSEIDGAGGGASVDRRIETDSSSKPEPKPESRRLRPRAEAEADLRTIHSKLADAEAREAALSSEVATIERCMADLKSSLENAVYHWSKAEQLMLDPDVEDVREANA
eukprot:CAMPEP_0177621396 /NCGR_PEP_ID=MMETSP0419_2-20121207/27564_1 /TAXON_ID=582737 /ORGANISM="Tetraselmis sp., Strain GSL018" /LENGTH=370 /DNA_ID=CAMNT_0019121313 /DNA_START=308 /DNA_END=1415 /DNA_ORIENTATION=-